MLRWITTSTNRLVESRLFLKMAVRVHQKQIPYLMDICYLAWRIKKSNSPTTQLPWFGLGTNPRLPKLPVLRVILSSMIISPCCSNSEHMCRKWCINSHFLDIGFFPPSIIGKLITRSIYKPLIGLMSFIPYHFWRNHGSFCFTRSHIIKRVHHCHVYIYVPRNQWIDNRSGLGTSFPLGSAT